MNTINWIWRQACNVKTCADELARNCKNLSAEQIEQSAAVIVCEAASSEPHYEQVACNNIANEVSLLQTATWEFIKNCADNALQTIARKLYYACSNFKRMLKKKLQQVSNTIKKSVEVVAETLPACTVPCATAVLSTT